VGSLERADDREQDRGHVGNGEAPLALEQCAQRLALEEVHDHDEHAVRQLDEVVDADHVRVPHGGSGANLALEATPVLLSRPLEEFQSEARVREHVARFPDESHGAFTEPTVKLVAAAYDRLRLELVPRHCYDIRKKAPRAQRSA
jgi:hypothetical protein